MRAALALLLALTLSAPARALDAPATCPGAGAATTCLYGTAPPASGASPVSVATITGALKNAGAPGVNPASAGVCLSLSYTCNAAMAALFASSATDKLVSGFAAACLGGGGGGRRLRGASFVQSGASYVFYAAVAAGADCAAVLAALQTGSASAPGAFSALALCGSASDCNAPSPPPPAPPPPRPPPPSPPPPALLDPSAPVINATLIFAGDYATLYGASAAARAAFTSAFVACIATTAPDAAAVSVDSVAPGSVRVGARVAFAPGVACSAGAATSCGALLATLAASPATLFAGSAAGPLAGLGVTTAALAVALQGAATTLVGPPQPGSVAPATPPVTSPTPTPASGGGDASAKARLGAILGVLLGLGIVGPGTALSVAMCFFQDPLRRFLLRRGWRLLADFLVPDPVGDVHDAVRVQLAELRVFVAALQRPPMLAAARELAADDVALEQGAPPLGAGGFGVVLRATLRGGTPVAVKALLHGGAAFGAPSDAPVPADVARALAREAAVLSRLNHPNVVRVFGAVPSRAWLVLELLDGGTLAETLRGTSQPLSAAEALRIAGEVATGVAYLHLPDVGVVHGDIKVRKRHEAKAHN